MENNKASNVEILIVEDSPVEAEMLRRILVRAGYSVYAAAKNGEDGLKTLHEHPCTLVISDVNMPLMNGYDLCYTIKYDEQLWATPVILVTSLSEPKDVIKALDVGADGYVTKPYIESILLGRIRSLLANPATRKLADERRRIKLEYAGAVHSIAVGSPQMANLMLSVYENSLVLNQELMHIQNQLTLLNDDLDNQVRERTAELATAAAKAQQKTAQVQALFDNNADGILAIDGDGRICAANAAAVELFDKPRESLLGSDFGDPLVAGATTEITIPDRDGKLREVGMRCANIVWEGQPAHLLTLRDITERKEAEHQLETQLDELRRWQNAMQGRETRIIELKHEVNELLARAGEAPRYQSAQ